MSKLVKDYFNYQQEFTQKYGNNTIVLMQVGSFYEFYGLNTDELTYKTVDANLTLDNTHLYTVSKLLGFSIAKKTNNILMAGVPKYAIDKHVKKLLDNNYTIVIIEQIGDDKKDVERKITAIYSPGTYLEDINYTKTNFLASIYVEKTETLNSSILEIGASCIDLSIGKNIIYEIPFKKEDNNYIYDELYKFINSYNPTEIIIEFKNITEKEQTKLIESLEVNKRIIKTVNYDKKYKKIEVQELILKEVFTSQTMIHIFEYLNIHRLQIGVYSYINLLLFIKEHDNSKLLNLEKPTIYTTNKLLNLNRSTIYRLNLIDNNYEENNTNINSLFDIVNMTTTNIGKRTLRSRLLFPITDTDLLQSRYDLADYFIENTAQMTEFKKELQNISDLERLHRKLASFKLSKDNDLLNLCITINYIHKIINQINAELLELLDLTQDNINEFNKFYTTLYSIFNLDNLYNRNINIFNKGYNNDIDTKNYEYNKQIAIFDTLCNKFTEIIKNEDKKLNDNLQQTLVDYEWTDRDNCYNIVTTEARAKKLKIGLAKKQIVTIKDEDYNINVPPKEIKKFIRDIEEQDSHGVFLSQNSGITSKPDFHIDIHKNNILFYLHNVNFDSQKIKTAVDIIDNLSSRINKINNDVNIENSISQEDLDNINNEYINFVNNKTNLIQLARDNQKKLLSSINDMEMPNIEKYLNSKFANVQSSDFLCDICNKFRGTSLKSLAAHKRSCKNKTQCIPAIDTEV